MEKQLPQRLHEWLNARGISDSVIATYSLSWNGKELIIPVQDENGVVLFNKYRRDPEVDTGPKYRYEKGATSALFGLQSIKDATEVFVCEGELDALVLISKGFAAVSTTGGSGTFEQEWKDHLFTKQVFICYDNDKPGWKGAFVVQDVIPWAKIVWLPSSVGEHGDITDYFVKLRKSADDFKKLITTARSYELPADYAEVATKKELTELARQYANKLDCYLEVARQMRTAYQSDAPVQLLLEMYRIAHADVTRRIKYFRKTRATTDKNRIEAAKQVSMHEYLKIRRDKLTTCPWHDDTNPSAHYYEKQNKIYCFSCSKGGDVIDVVQTLNNCNLEEALTLILGTP